MGSEDQSFEGIITRSDLIEQMLMISYLAFTIKGQRQVAAAFKGSFGPPIWEALRSERRRARRARRCEFISQREM